MSEIRVVPSAERAQHTGIEILPHAIADDAGVPSLPFRSIDILKRMHDRGAISSEERQAGEQFKNDFDRAHASALRAADPARPHVSYQIPQDIGTRVLQARNRLYDALNANGGQNSPAGSCLWHVLGLGETIKRWTEIRALNYSPYSQNEASGILRQALYVLANHYGFVKESA